MNTKPFLSCVVPAYNEAENLKTFIPALANSLKQQNLSYEIIVVDDGSKDDTIPILQTMIDDYPLVVLELSRNFGKEAALSAGLDHVTGEVTLLIDADFQHPFEAIPTMINLWKNGYDMVYGIRNRTTESWLKRVLTQGYYRVLNLSSPIDIPESAGDFRLLDAKVVEAIKQLPEKNRYMKGLYAWVGFKSIGVNFSEQERQHGRSSFNVKSLFNLAMSGLTGFSDLPLRLCIYLGAILALGAMGYGIWIILNTLIEGVSVPGWATLAAGMTLLGGIQLLFLGIVGEYVGRIYAEVKTDQNILFQPNILVLNKKNLSQSRKIHSLISNMFAHILQLMRFTTTGAAAALTHYSVVMLLFQKHVALQYANLLAFLVAYWVSYFGHRIFTFKAQHLDHRQTLPKFTLVAGLGFYLMKVFFTFKPLF